MIAIGASAGGADAIARVLADLDGDLPGSVVVTIHLAPSVTDALLRVLARGSALPVAWAEDGMPLVHRRVYVAPPNHHTLLEPDRLRVVPGPRENHCRPSINVSHPRKTSRVGLARPSGV